MSDFIAKDSRGTGLCQQDRVEIISTISPMSLWIIGVKGYVQDSFTDFFGNTVLRVLTSDGEPCIIYPQNVVKINYYETKSRYVTFH